MDKTSSNQDLEWARAAVSSLLERLAARAARDLEAQAAPLLAAAARLREARR